MEILPHFFEGNEVRIIISKNGVRWAVAADVCAAVGLKNPRQVLTRLDNDEKSTVRLTDGGPEHNIINEPGLYRLLLRSKKKSAKRFQRWLAHDVVPQIRKTGSYSLKPEPYKLPQTYLEALKKLVTSTEENEKLKAENTNVKYELTLVKPKARVYDYITASTGLVCISDAAKILNIPPHKFSNDLVEDSYCFKRRGKLMPYSKYIKLGWMEVKLVLARDNKGHSYRQTFITPLGISKFREIYNPKQQQRRLFA